MAAAGVIDLEVVLRHRAEAADRGQVWVEGGFVRRVPTVPLDGGLEQIVSFAAKCWRATVELQCNEQDRDDLLKRRLERAEFALRELIAADGMTSGSAVALANVQLAIEAL